MWRNVEIIVCELNKSSALTFTPGHIIPSIPKVPGAAVLPGLLY